MDTSTETNLPILKTKDLGQKFEMRPGFMYVVVGPLAWGKGFSLKDAWVNAKKPRRADVIIAWSAVSFSSFRGLFSIDHDDLPVWAAGLDVAEREKQLYRQVAVIRL